MQTVDESTMDDVITTVDFATLFSQEELKAKRAEEKVFFLYSLRCGSGVASQWKARAPFLRFPVSHRTAADRIKSPPVR